MVGKFRNADVIIRGYAEARHGWVKEIDLAEDKFIGKAVCDVVKPYLKIMLPMGFPLWGNKKFEPTDVPEPMSLEIERIEVKVFYRE